jgi:hypothetical protein
MAHVAPLRPKINTNPAQRRTERGLLGFSLTTGTPRPVPQTEKAGLRDVRTVATGTLRGRPVAVALERYGRRRCHRSPLAGL